MPAVTATTTTSDDAPDAAEAFCVVKNGIRMPGMPGFGTTHSDEKIWAIVAFLEELPRLDAATYRERLRATRGAHHDHHDHDAEADAEAEGHEAHAHLGHEHGEHEEEHDP